MTGRSEDFGECLKGVSVAKMNMEPHMAVVTINILIFVMIIQLSFTSIYVYRHVSKHTILQHRFTELFAKEM